MIFATEVSELDIYYIYLSTNIRRFPWAKVGGSVPKPYSDESEVEPPQPDALPVACSQSQCPKSSPPGGSDSAS